MKTERVTLLISPNEKRKLQNLAEDRGITASELVRRAVHAFGTTSTDETGELAALTAEMRAAIPGMRKSLRDANLAAERAIAAIGRSRTDTTSASSRHVAEPRKRRAR